MKRTIFLFSILISLLLIFAVTSTTYAACSAVPTNRIITTTGTYCLTGNLSVSTTTGGITINNGVNNVTIDLAGFELKNTNPGNGSGIYGPGTNSNITVKNGSISGFWDCIRLGDSANAVNVLIDGIRFYNFGRDAVKAEGCIGLVVKNCVVFGNSQRNWGVHSNGSSFVNIFNNDIIDVSSGIEASACVGCVIEGNRISGSITNPNNLQGILVDDALVENNRISNFLEGIRMNGEAAKYRNNLTLGCTTTFIGGFDAGNNN